MFSYRRTSFVLIVLWMSLLGSLFFAGIFIRQKEEILNTEVTYSNSTLSAIVFADRDAITDTQDVDVAVIFEEAPNYNRMIRAVDANYLDDIIIKEKADMENTIDKLEAEMVKNLHIVGNEYVDEKLKESQQEKVNVRGLDFIYDPSLSDINKENLAERFKVFAPKDDYYKVLKAMSQMALGEAGGCSPTEIAATVWSVLNRFDNGYSNSIFVVISAPNQYHGYSPNKGLREDVYLICEDVIARWVAEKEGKENVGRVLPSDYNWFYGDGKHNHFRNQYRTNRTWDWSLPTPYNDLAALADKTPKNWL